MIQIDMEMPQNCWECRFRHAHSDYRCSLVKDYTEEYETYNPDERLPVCPLIEIRENEE